MKKLVFGSLNIDRTYRVDHFVSKGETMSADSMELFCGGKGFNQAVAMARAGSKVYFAGAVGKDGDFLLASMNAEGIDTKYVKLTQGDSGHAVIQVDRKGSNCIMIFSAANGEITHDDVDNVLSDFGSGDLIVLQNEISSLDYIIERAHSIGMLVALNPSPFDAKLSTCDFSKVNYLIVNEVEGAALSGKRSWRDIIETIHNMYPGVNLLLTLGENGSIYTRSDGTQAVCGIMRTEACDTTAAGDTFAGYFLSAIAENVPVRDALETAAIASGIAVSRPGASPSIPYAQEVSAYGRDDLSAFVEA